MPASRRVAGPQVYVVQRLGQRVEGIAEWTDIAAVTVPARSKRKSIIEAALATDSALKLPLTVRVLDADAAREIAVGLRQREPELEIG